MKLSFRFVLSIGMLVLVLISCSTTVISFKVEPANHNFGQVNIGDSATFDFVLSNKKSVDMTLTNVSLTTGEFTEISGAQGKTIVAKGTLTITVQFSPALPGGSKADKMLLQWTDFNGKTGTKNVSLAGDAMPVARINAPTTYDFGTVGIGNTVTHDFDIENTGTADLVLSLFNFNGNATLFSLTAGGTIPVTIIPGATHTVTVQFAPTATGSFPTVLEITHNAVNAIPPAEITISAAGGGGKIELNQTSPWNFGTVMNGGSFTGVVEISNTGSIDLNINSVGLATGSIFTIDKIEDSSGNPATTPFAISPADHVEISIKFSPTTAGNYNDTLNIAHDGSYTASPATLNLEGVGRAPITQTFNYLGSIANWTVPAGVTSLRVEVWGAQGGTTGSAGGKGSRMRGDFTVNPSTLIKILVGQQGGSGSSSCLGGGGGATYVWENGSNDPMIVGGAGGGSAYGSGATPGVDSVITNNGADGAGTYAVGGAGTGGNGGVAPNGSTRRGGAGAGWLTDGADGVNSSSGTDARGGKCPANGGTGGMYGGNSSSNRSGGFGGGGGSQGRNGASAAGAGGGYSGGGPGTENPYSSSYSQAAGGGGGSYNDGTNQSNTAAIKTNNGQAVITY